MFNVYAFIAGISAAINPTNKVNPNRSPSFSQMISIGLNPNLKSDSEAFDNRTIPILPKIVPNKYPTTQSKILSYKTTKSN